MRGVQDCFVCQVFRTWPLVQLACKMSFEVSIESASDLRLLAPDLRKDLSGRQATERKV